MLTESNLVRLKRYCGGDYTQIEGYWEALNDMGDTRYCTHHKDEILPDGTVISVKQLIAEGRYYGVAPDRLVIMELGEHSRLHFKGIEFSDEHKHKIGESLKGRFISEEAKRKLSESRKGRKRSEETKRKISAGLKGKPSGMKGKPQTKCKWLTPTGEIREMPKPIATRWHKDWIRITE